MTTTTQAATILVVDDDEGCREIAARLLERAGYRTRRAESGDECLRIALAEPIDVILLDIMMPGMDGFAVCEALRAAGKRIPVILLTARDDMDARLEGMNLGVSEFLTKPINRVELLASVAAQVHILELARQLESVERNLKALGQAGQTEPRR